MTHSNFLHHVPGKKKKDLLLFALSTCIWCQKTKKLLGKLNLEYHYIDVDLVKGKKQEEVEGALHSWNPHHSFPTLVVEHKRAIIGYQEQEIKKLIK